MYLVSFISGKQPNPTGVENIRGQVVIPGPPYVIIINRCFLSEELNAVDLLRECHPSFKSSS